MAGRIRRVSPALIAATVAIGLAAGVVVAPTADARSTAHRAATVTIAASRHAVLQSDPVTLTGRAGSTQTVYRSVNGHAWSTIARVRTVHGRYATVVHPIPGALTRYRVGTSRAMNVHSTACAPLRDHTGPQAWFNVRKAPTSAMAAHWRQLICSAAPHSTISLAVMFLFGGTRAVDSMIAALRAVAALRRVTVRLLVQRSTYPSEPTKYKWTWAQFRRAFTFADVDWCTQGCSVSGPNSSMHAKYMAVSALLWGGSAVVEATINWSPQQLDRQNGSAIYFYRDATLYRGFVDAFRRGQQRTPATAASQTAGWHPAGPGVAYAFDPSSITGDPIVAELRTLHCEKGDHIRLATANVTRSRLVNLLSRFHDAGCEVVVITQQSYRAAGATFTIRHARTHDRFLVVLAHRRDGSRVHEVISGAEVYRPESMTLAEEQLVRVSTPSVVAAHERWIDRLAAQR